MSRQVVIKATEGHRSFGALLKRVFRSDEHLVVERDGFPVAVVMSYNEYERITGQRARAAFERFSRALSQEVERQGMTEEQLLATVKETRKELYEERYGRRD